MQKTINRNHPKKTVAKFVLPSKLPNPLDQNDKKLTQLTAYDREFEKAMEIYREGGNKYRNALRELAE